MAAQLLNFTGTQRDVATLAHESGHGVHNMLSYEQGILQFHPPLTLAETASIFGEMIVFRDLLDKVDSIPPRVFRLAATPCRCYHFVLRVLLCQ
eukprot:1179111-Prorocentrum_minimum.AAC.1